MQTSMSRGEPIAVPFVLGRWRVDPERNTVRGPDGCVCLEPKMMAVLTQLAAAPGVTLSKDHLLEHVWPRRYVVEGVLKRAVSELRRVLNDDARQPRYIETVYKVGYRLIRTPRCATVGVQRSVTVGSADDIAALIDRMAPAWEASARLTLIVERACSGSHPGEGVRDD